MCVFMFGLSNVCVRVCVQGGVSAPSLRGTFQEGVHVSVLIGPHSHSERKSIKY